MQRGLTLTIGSVVWGHADVSGRTGKTSAVCAVSHLGLGVAPPIEAVPLLDN
jgi:hypothetical protein